MVLAIRQRTIAQTTIEFIIEVVIIGMKVADILDINDSVTIETIINL